jgi:hypothetical protein
VTRLRERVARVEADQDGAECARRIAEAATTHADRRVDALNAELREIRRPLWERLAEFIRRR